MPTLKANAVVSDPAVRADWLTEAQAAADKFNLKANRVAVVGEDSVGLRLRAELQSGGPAAYSAVESSMVSHNVEPGSWIRLSADDGSTTSYREWPPMPTT